jgi:hypothetical protein
MALQTTIDTLQPSIHPPIAIVYPVEHIMGIPA